MWVYVYVSTYVHTYVPCMYICTLSPYIMPIHPMKIQCRARSPVLLLDVFPTASAFSVYLLLLAMLHAHCALHAQCSYVCTCIYAHMSFSCIRMRVSRTQDCMHVCVFLPLLACLPVCMHVCNVCMRACTHVYMHVCIYVQNLRRWKEKWRQPQSER